MKRVIQPNPNCISIDCFDANCIRFYESVMSQTNGYMGIRGNFEETFSGDHLQGTYFAGVWHPDKTRVGWWKNGYPEFFGKTINAASIIGIRVFVEDEEIDLAQCDILEFWYRLSLQTAELKRHMVIRTQSGCLRIESSRFLSMADKEVCAIRYSVTPIEKDLAVKLVPYIDFHVRNEDANYEEIFWQPGQGQSFDNGGYISARTVENSFEKTRYDAGVAMQVIQKKEAAVSAVPCATCGYSEWALTYALKKDQTAQIEKIVAVATSRDVQDVRHRALACAESAAQKGYDALFEAHRTAIADQLSCTVAAEGDDAALQGLRYGLMQLMCTYHGQDSRLNIGPKGFTGEKYGGAAYWDTEGFLLPFYLGVADAQVAKNLLMFRYQTLDEARNNAKKLGLAGALYPMVTFDGHECHNEWEITFEEIHRNGAIAYAVFNYVTYTDDISFLLDYGFEILLEISRFWADRVHYCAAKQVYMLHGVTGPNEYENNVNNNWYTNRIAKWTLQYTASLMDTYCGQLKVPYEEHETQKFKEIAENMMLPYDRQRKVFVQHDTFLDKGLAPAADIDPAQRPICRHWSWDRILRSCYIKQADVLQGLFFLEHDFDRTVIQRNFDFYEPLTVHESSLSAGVHSVIASWAGRRDKAYELFVQAVRLDLDDINSDTSDGLHVTAMSGGWLAVVKGFADMRTARGILEFAPYLPAELKRYAFAIRYRGRMIKVAVDPTGVTLTKSEGRAVDLMVFGKTYCLEDQLFVPLQKGAAESKIAGFIFDLDGVLTDTAQLHYQAWKKLAWEEWQFNFTVALNEQFKGVERRTCMRMLARMMDKDMPEQQIAYYADMKNAYYLDLIKDMSRKDLKPNVRNLLAACRERGIRTAVASASKNTRQILKQTGINDDFDAIVDGHTVSRPKPDPECFETAAKWLGLARQQCLIFEDAQSAVDAAVRAGFACVGVGAKKLSGTQYHLENIGDLKL